MNTEKVSQLPQKKYNHHNRFQLFNKISEYYWFCSIFINQMQSWWT